MLGPNYLRGMRSVIIIILFFYFLKNSISITLLYEHNQLLRPILLLNKKIFNKIIIWLNMKYQNKKNYDFYLK